MDPERLERARKRFAQNVLITLIFTIYAALIVGHAAYESAQAGDGIISWSEVADLISDNLANPTYIWPLHTGVSLMIGLAGVVFCLYLYTNYVRNRNKMPGKDHGSGGFNTNYKQLLHDYIMSPRVLKKAFPKKKYKTKKIAGGRTVCKKRGFNKLELAICRLQSQIYSKRVALSLDTRLTQLNLNTVVFGGSGAGKSRFFVKPNLLQANSSYVVTDPSGELLATTGTFLENNGYTIKVLNIENMNKSMRYNPFAYCREDADIPVMVNALTSNIKGPEKKGGDPFWENAEKALIIALCGYLFETQPPEGRNFTNVMRLLHMANPQEDPDTGEAVKDDLDRLFDELRLANPASYALRQYETYKKAGSGKTANSILISVGVTLGSFFDLEKVENLTYKDELHLEEIGKKKCALFIITPQGDTTYNFLASMLYTQLFDTLYKLGEHTAEENGSTSVALPVPVRCLIDEAANIGTIPNFPEKLSTMRKYNISACPIYQNQAQVKALMKDQWETIVGNCDTMLFLGGIDASTVKTVSERLGKGTIDGTSRNMNYGRRGGGGETTNALGRNVLDTNEVEQMPNDHCIVFIRSLKPFFDFKYPLEQHPNYKLSGDWEDKHGNTPYFYKPKFNIEIDRDELDRCAVRPIGEDGHITPEPKKRNVSKESLDFAEKVVSEKRGTDFVQKTKKARRSIPISFNNSSSPAAAPAKEDEPNASFGEMDDIISRKVDID